MRPPQFVSTVWPFALFAAFASLTTAPSVSFDSIYLAGFHLSFITPHFPPLYPMFAHVMSSIASVLDWIAGGPTPQLGLLAAPPFYSTAARVLMLAQHGLTIASAAYLAHKLRPDLLSRRVIVAVLYLNPFTLQITHGIQTESLVIPATYAAAAEAVVFLAAPAKGRLAAFMGWTLVASLARHPAILLGALIPIALFAGIAMAALARDWRGARLYAIYLAWACAGLVGVQAASMLVNYFALRSIGAEIASVTGRAFTYRLSREYLHVLPGLVGGRLDRVVERLKATATDPDLANDIEVVANTPAPWTGPYNAIQNAVRAKCPLCSQAEVNAEVDRRLNRVMLHALLTPHRDLAWDVLLRTRDFLADSPGKTQIFGMEERPLPTFNPFEHFLWKGRDIEFGLSPYAAFLRVYLFRAAVVVVALSFLIGTPRSARLLSLGLLGAAVMYSFMVSLVTVYIPRYGLFVDQLALIAVVASVIASGQRLRHRQQRRAA
jgi:hypothetical protein